jgi:polyhydroxyalkanoate synthesis regulator phasin
MTKITMAEHPNCWITREEALRLIMTIEKRDREGAEKLLDELVAKGEIEYKEIWKQ